MGSAPSMEIVLCLTSAIFISIHESIPVPKYRIGNRSDSIPFVFVLFCFFFFFFFVVVVSLRNTFEPRSAVGESHFTVESGPEECRFPIENRRLINQTTAELIRFRFSYRGHGTVGAPIDGEGRRGRNEGREEQTKKTNDTTVKKEMEEEEEETKRRKSGEKKMSSGSLGAAARGRIE